MKIVRTKSGYAISGDGNEPYYLYEARTKRACAAWLAEAAAIQARNAAHRQEHADRIAATGFVPVTLDQLTPGAMFAYLKPNGELSEARPIARVNVLNDQAAMIYHDDNRPGRDPFTLASAAYQPYMKPARASESPR